MFDMGLRAMVEQKLRRHCVGVDPVCIAFGEALRWAQHPRTGEYMLVDVHGAGARRSDPKTGDATGYAYGRGPQGDVMRIDNLVRCIRG